MKQRPKHNRLQRGIATLEFMIVAPILILVVFAVTEFGWAFHQYHTMTRATRDGARHLAANALLGSVGIIYLRDNVVQQTRNLVVYGKVSAAAEPLLPGWSTSDISVTSPDPEHVRVSARYRYVPVIGTIPTFYGGEPLSLSFEMHSTVQMRAL